MNGRVGKIPKPSDDPISPLVPIYTSLAFSRAAQAVGNFIEFWGFKRIHGIIWFLLYLSPRPLSQQEIVSLTRFSKASVSIALRELEVWGVIRPLVIKKGRSRFYEAETNLGTMVRRVLKRRERWMLKEASKNLAELLAMIKREGTPSPHMSRRLETLLHLTRAVLYAIDEFLERSRITITTVKRFFLRDLR